MYRVPRFWRRFRRMLTAQDLVMGRKALIKSTINGREHYSIEVVPKPLERPAEKA